jgi:penicillin amidase
MTFDVPGMQVSGIDVPGIPGIIVGATPSLAWGLTSGVADTDDVFWYPSLDADRYQFGTETLDLIRTTSVLKVKGKPDEVVERLSTPEGPVILSKPGKVIFVRASAYRGRELEAVTTLGHLVEARTAADLQESLRAEEPMSFNLFFATKDNHIGWRYMGAVPVRAPGIDPRLPVKATPDTVWRGLVSTDQMPHILDPRAGLIANWNNKPVSWWPNGDTPVWGQIFRNSSLLSFLQKPKLNAQDAELAAWSIARNDETWPYFRPYLRNAIPGFDGRLLDGSRGAGIYAGFLDALRNEIFLGTTGNFASPANFRLVTQPTLLLRALQRRTKVDYLGTRTAAEVVAAALKTASTAPPYRSGGIRVPDQVAVPYGNRGTYIQIVEMLANGPYGRNVASPGVSERGPHAFDQVPLARSWTYKSMPTWP